MQKSGFGKLSPCFASLQVYGKGVDMFSKVSGAITFRCRQSSSEWLEKRSLVCDYANIGLSADDLNLLLRRFYAEVKSSKKQGSSSKNNGGI